LETKNEMKWSGESGTGGGGGGGGAVVVWKAQDKKVTGRQTTVKTYVKWQLTKQEMSKSNYLNTW